jgi:hypothetical protein
VVVKQGSSACTKTKSNKFNHGESIAQVTEAIKTELKQKKRNSSHLRTLKKSFPNLKWPVQYRILFSSAKRCSSTSFNILTSEGKVILSKKYTPTYKNSYNLSDLVFLRSEAVTKLQNLPN